MVTFAFSDARNLDVDVRRANEASSLGSNPLSDVGSAPGRE